jgi:phage terminase small subunit
MRQRGRISANAVSIRPSQKLYSADAPDYLSPSQKQVWQSTVERLGHDWFPAEVLPLLEQYCCVVVVARSLARQVEDETITGEQRNDVMRWWHAYTTLMAQLATKLRITTQATRVASKQKQKVHAASTAQKKPWQTASREN